MMNCAFIKLQIKRALIFVSFIAKSYSIIAQEFPKKEIDLAQLADELYGFQDLDLNYEDIYENLALLLAHPINLNTVNAEELRFIKILTETQIQNIIDYRNENGNFLSVYELQAVPGFDLQTIYHLIPFAEVHDPLTVIDESLLTRIVRNKENYLLFRYERTIENKKGFLQETVNDQRFKGSPDKLYLRFRTSKPNDFSVGFTMEKDQGEALQWDRSTNHYGFDYFSFHAQIQNKGSLKNIIIGDYQAQYGQGLTFGGAFGVGKGGETVTTTRRSNVGLLPYTSLYEAGYFRGVAATASLTKNILLTGLYSNTNRDATVATGAEEDISITSFQTTGLHRNNNELSKRKQIGEQIFGGVLQYNTRALDAGVLFQTIRFDFPVYRKPAVYNQFTFEGKENTNAGAYLNYTFRNFTFFSEASQSYQHGKAYLLGTLMSLTSKLDISIVHRNYEKNFYSFYSNAFGENTTAQNESGIYWGWKYRMNKKINTTGYVDFFKFPWLKFRSYVPSAGHEWLLRLNYQPSRSVLIFFQVREEVKTRNLSDNNLNVYLTDQGKKHNYWINFDYGIGKHVHMKSRAQISTYNFNTMLTHGFVILHDIGFTLGRFQFKCRYAIFNTDDFDNRQYVYESDVWLAYSLPAYYGTGLKKYVLIEYNMNKHLSFWLRCSNTRYTDRETIGSGVDLINSNTRNDIKFEARIRF